MKYSKIETYFEKGELGITDLIKECSGVFESIDEYKDTFMNNTMSTPDEYKEALNKLTGFYFYLEPIFTISQAYKEIKEDEAYCNLRVQAETEGKKFTADALKVEAHRAVSHWIRVRNVMESYVNCVEKGITTCQTQLRRIQEDSKFKPGEQQ